jgi:hypothetical protein
MPYRKRRNTNEDSTKKVLAAKRVLDEHNERNDEKMKFCKDGGYPIAVNKYYYYYYMQKINEVECTNTSQSNTTYFI